MIASTIEKPPSVVVTLGRQLTEFGSGYISFRSGGAYKIGSWGFQGMEALRRSGGDLSSVAIGITERLPNQTRGRTFEIQTGMARSHIHFSYMRRLPGASDRRLKWTVGLGTLEGLAMTLGGVWRVNERFKMSLGVECGSTSGVLVRLR